MRKDRKKNAADSGYSKPVSKKKRKISDRYAKAVETIQNVMRGISSLFDRALTNRRMTKLAALVLAVVMYVIVNASSITSLYSSGISSSRSKTGVSITVQYNSDTYEISGLPETVDVTFTGDAASVTSAANADGMIVADLEGLSEGTHVVELTGEGYGDSVKILIEPSTVTVTLKKKTTQEFELSYDFTNQNQMDDTYTIGEPEFEYTKVNVKASADTLDTIAFVKALIDVSGQTETFEQDARLVAYDAEGQVVDADIEPETVHCTVPVYSYSKEAAVEVEISGELPDDTQTLSSISLSTETVTIYGSESDLEDIDTVTVTLDVSAMTQDSTVLRPINLPSGVTSADVSQVTMVVTLGEKTSEVIEDVPVTYINDDGFTVSETVYTSVEVTGTQENIASVSAEDITVYVDLSDATAGTGTYELVLEQSENPLLTYELTESSIELTVTEEEE